MDLLQIFMNIYFAALGAYLSVVMARISKQNGRVLDKIDITTKMLAEKMDEGFKRMDEGFKRMDRGLELIAKLIVEENERIRKEILGALAK